MRKKNGPFTLEPLELDPPSEGEVLVRIAACGICRADLSVRDQHYPTPLPVVLGHEGAGVVEGVGKGVKTVSVGDHVLMTFAFCGQCPSCALGVIATCWHHMEMNFSGKRYSGHDWSIPAPLFQYDANGGVREQINGAFFNQSAFATHAIATEANVVVIDKSADLQTLAPLGCGFQTGAGAIMNVLRPEVGASLLVTGAGSAGLAAVMAAKIIGCDPIIILDTVDSKLRLALDLGATHVINGSKTKDAVSAVKTICPHGVAYAIEGTGNPAVFRNTVDVLQPTGVCGLIGGAPQGTEVAFDMTHLLFGRTVKGILQGGSRPKSFLPKLTKLHQQGRFPIEKLIAHYEFSNIEAAVDALSTGHVIKPVLTMQ
ncbi:NAD(P)-dependent alcohol dehydrogenase [Microbulbifer spongiae]|uniref:NAD(P)-dependent alcohol dehydrogenase n=1 Tax=Microbulbifer spongiae TaxID=2944933 RepID=A0ABY9EHP0_9GAMM|nr:NAD(P)-dependent alcohol dehydrogenase [Microbulbifer sp. MI-G]WKD51269.1 NAD(P)-dependent alcohol dehydrogenase [Microbulbifer sp. MI-G]